MPIEIRSSAATPASRAARYGRLLLAVLFTLAIVAVTTDVLTVGPLTQLDRSVGGLLGAEPTGCRYLALYVLTLPGQRWLTIALAVPIAVWLGWRLRSARPLLMLTAGWAALAVVGETMKTVTGRLAPHADHIALHAGGASYPSGHAANIVLTSGLLVYLTQAHPTLQRHRYRLAAGAFLVSFITGSALILIGFHWVSDVIAGYLLGSLLLTATVVCADAWAEAAVKDHPVSVDRSAG